MSWFTCWNLLFYTLFRLIGPFRMIGAEILNIRITWVEFLKIPMPVGLCSDQLIKNLCRLELGHQYFLKCPLVILISIWG